MNNEEIFRLVSQHLCLVRIQTILVFIYMRVDKKKKVLIYKKMGQKFKIKIELLTYKKYYQKEPKNKEKQ